MPYYTPSENLPEGTGTGTQEIRDTPVQKPRNRVVDTLFSVKSYLEWRRHDTSKSITALECFCLISRGRLGDPTVRKKICISYTWLKSGAPLARYFFISRQRWIGLCCIYCFDWRMWPPQFTFRFFFIPFFFIRFHSIHFFWGGGEGLFPINKAYNQLLCRSTQSLIEMSPDNTKQARRDGHHIRVVVLL